MKKRSIMSNLVALSLLLLLRVEVCLGRGTEQEMMEALDESKQEGDTWKYAPLSGPHFDSQHSRNVSSHIGKTSVLNCRVKYAGGKTISWIRGRDLHLLTVGRFTYTSDDRFKAVHHGGSEDWLLKIHYVQMRDQGPYECQVSTTPPLAHTVHLTVVAEPETKILGGPDIYINSGSTINLTCVVRHSPTPPSYILWYRNKQLLSYDSPRGGITIVTEHGPISSSRLLIQRATLSDGGKYVCKPANMNEQAAVVHVIHNERPAAIHKKKNGTFYSSGEQMLSSASVCIALLEISLIWLQYASSCALPEPKGAFQSKPIYSLTDRSSKLSPTDEPHRGGIATEFIKNLFSSLWLPRPVVALSGTKSSNKFFQKRTQLLHLDFAIASKVTLFFHEEFYIY